MTLVLSQARKITCAGVRRLRGLRVVFTPTSRRLQGNRHCLYAKHLDLSKKKISAKKTATTQIVAITRKGSLLLAECRTTSSLCLGRRAPNLRRAKQMVGLVAIELALGPDSQYRRSQILLAS